METITNYDELLFSFVVFFFEVVERIFDVCVTWGLMIGVFFVIFKYIMFRKDPAGWETFAESVRSGVNDAGKAFASAMSGVKEIARHWTHEKIRELRG